MDQKLENILNLALETPEEEREQTESLNVGYSAESRSLELIVKYHGSLDGLREQNIVVEELIAGYAILTVPETLVDTVSETPEIEYVEKPKRFYYQQTRRILLSTGDKKNAFSEWKGRSFGCIGFRKHLGSGGVPQGRWQYEDTVSMGSDDTMGSDDSGKAGRITGAGDAAESDIATESDNAGGNGRYGIWEDTGWISHRD